MSNVNYDKDILIFPVTNNLSDITNTDVTVTNAINVNIISLVDGKGIAIYKNNSQLFKDFNNEIENKLIFNDTTNVDMTVYSYNIYNIFIDDTDNIKAYLYNNKRKRISDIFEKNITVDYKIHIDLTGINLSDPRNYQLDSTIVLDASVQDNNKIVVEHISGTYNDQYLMDSFINNYEFNTSDSTNLIYSLYQDTNNRVLNYNNDITLYVTDSTGVQVSKKVKREYNVKHLNCETPLMTPIITEGTNYNTQYASSTDANTYVGGQHSCCQYTRYINVTFQPYGMFQKDLEYFSLYDGYEVSGGLYIYYDTPALITSYSSQGDDQDEDVRGPLDTTNTIIEHETIPDHIYNNHNIINYTEDSIFLQFKQNHDILSYYYNNVHTVRVRNKRTNDIGIGYFPNDYNNIPTYFEDYTNTETYGEENIFGPNYYTTSSFVEQKKYNLRYNNQDNVNSEVINNSSYEQKYSLQRNYQNISKIPIMLRIETNHKVNFKLEMNGATDFPDRINNLIDTTINPGEPFELRQSEDFYINPATYYFVTFQFELLDTTTIDLATAQDIEFNVQLTPIRDDRAYILKENLNFQHGDEIEFFSLQGRYNSLPYYMYNISDIDNFTLDNVAKCNKPHIEFDKGSNDLTFEIPELSKSDITSTLSLNFKVYEVDSTAIPDYTTVNNLNVGDIVHVYGFELNTTYVTDSYIVPDNTNILQSNVYKVPFKTATGSCSIPIVVRDSIYGEQTVTCAGNCRPAYTYVTSYYADGNTMHHITYQDGLNTAQGEPNEILTVHPYNNRGYNVYLDSTEAVVCMRPYAIRYATEKAGVFFAFSCIGDDLSYGSPEVIESENYPTQTMLPPGSLLYYYAGRTTQKQYEHSYVRGEIGSYSSDRWYRINSGSQIRSGTASYAYLSISTGQTIEVYQRDYYGNHNNSQSIKKKRQA